MLPSDGTPEGPNYDPLISMFAERYSKGWVGGYRLKGDLFFWGGRLFRFARIGFFPLV